MFPDKRQFNEAAYIGEELFDSPAYELDRQCQSVQKGVERELFTVDIGLDAYGVSKEQYEEYLGKNMANQLSNAVLLQATTEGPASYLHVINNMLIHFKHKTSQNSLTHLTGALRAIKKLSEEVEQNSGPARI